MLCVIWPLYGCAVYNMAIVLCYMAVVLCYDMAIVLCCFVLCYDMAIVTVLCYFVLCYNIVVVLCCVMLWLCDRTLLSIVLCCVTVKSGGAVFCYDNRHSCTVLCQLCYGCAFTVLCYAMVVPYQAEITQWL